MKKFIAILSAIVLLLPVIAIQSFAAADPSRSVLIQAGNVFGNLYCGDMVNVSSGGDFTVKISGLNITNTSDTGFFIAVKSGNTSVNNSTDTSLPNGTLIKVTSAKINGKSVNLNGSPSNTISDGKVDMVCKLGMWGTNIFNTTIPATVNSVELRINVAIPGKTQSPETAVTESQTVVFDNPSGNNVGVESPWNFFGVGSFWGNNADLDISFAEIKQMIVNGGTTFSYVFSGTNPGTPRACFNFNLYGNPAKEINVPCDVKDIGGGKYEATVALDTLADTWKAAGKTLDDPDVAAFLIQPWASNFKLYSAKFITPKATTVEPKPTPTPDPKPIDAPDVPLDGFMADVSVDTFCPDNYIGSKNGVSYGKVISTEYYSTTCGMKRPVNIVLPAGYTAAKRYPVMYVLHGIFCDENTMMESWGTHTIIQNMIADGTAREMILVFPDMYASSDPNQQPSFDNPESVKPYDNFVNDLVNDLMPFIAENYYIASGKDNTAIFGFSMGGRESLAIGFMHPEKFGYVGAVAPAPGLTPGADWAMTHPGMFKESELVFTSEKPYLLMIGAGDKDGTVGQFPKSYHKILNTNLTQHIWYEIPGSDHADPAIASVTYNFAKNAFKATAAPKPVEIPKEVFFSPYTGSDSTGNGTKASPFKTEAKAGSYAKSFGTADITILEYMMGIDVRTGEGTTLSAPTGTINIIPFTASVDSHYFKGSTVGTGCDTQKYGVSGSPCFSARYMLSGKDSAGKDCKIFVENNGNSLENCTPTIFTDSEALKDWNYANMRSIVTPNSTGVLVEIFVIH